ncbi:hypothetical protein H8E77_22235 [bacterium]|nr:hypothetical protein [bacterium]
MTTTYKIQIDEEGKEYIPVSKTGMDLLRDSLLNKGTAFTEVVGAGIYPTACLPITLDVGTNNEKLLNDPVYLGTRRKRLRGEEYFDFIDTFVQGIRRNLPNAIIQWEDFSKQNAFTVLDKYKNEITSFNDDIQGTGAMALAGTLSALKIIDQKLQGQVFVIFGADAGGIGIARRVYAGLLKVGLSESEAKARIYTLDSKGLYWFSLGISHISVVSGLVPVLFASQDAHKGLDYG